MRYSQNERESNGSSSQGQALSIQESTATSLLPPLSVPVAVRAGAPASSWGLCEEVRVGEALRLQWLPVSFPEHRAHKSSGMESGCPAVKYYRNTAPRFPIQRLNNPFVFRRL